MHSHEPAAHCAWRVSHKYPQHAGPFARFQLPSASPRARANSHRALLHAAHLHTHTHKSLTPLTRTTLRNPEQRLLCSRECCLSPSLPAFSPRPLTFNPTSSMACARRTTQASTCAIRWHAVACRRRLLALCRQPQVSPSCAWAVRIHGGMGPVPKRTRCVARLREGEAPAYIGRPARHAAGALL